MRNTLLLRNDVVTQVLKRRSSDRTKLKKLNHASYRKSFVRRNVFVEKKSTAELDSA